MRFFFDNNLPPSLAHALRELSKSESSVQEVIHLRDRFPETIKDKDWIAALATEGHWVVVSQDRFRKNDLEREALRASGLIVFSLDRGWAHHAYWDKAQNLVRWWPAIIDQASRFQGGAALRVPWRLSGKGRFEQIRL